MVRSQCRDAVGVALKLGEGAEACLLKTEIKSSRAREQAYHGRPAFHARFPRPREVRFDRRTFTDSARGKISLTLEAMT